MGGEPGRGRNRVRQESSLQQALNKSRVIAYRSWVPTSRAPLFYPYLSRVMSFSTLTRGALVALLIPAFLSAQGRRGGRGAGAGSGADTANSGDVSWRNIGPDASGRMVAVAGSDARPNEYYFGTTGGGVWKTTDGGKSAV